ncbi:MAG: methyltransferase domain-containing protein, partial [Firmicutes bacterium]|nr:methyltransferase domain-containing protein [Bacillota bacterium]
TDWKKPPAVVTANLPDWLHTRLLQEFGKKRTREMIRALNGRSPLTLRVNTSKAAPEQLIRFLEEDGWQAEKTVLPCALRLTRGEDAVPLEKTAVIQTGLAVMQDLAAILSVALAAPKRGDSVLDLCAAPGGKALHAADLSGPEGSVLACDLTENKIRLLEENISRCGFENVRTQMADARIFDPEKEGRYDLVIADLPCSGLGVMGRKPEIRYRVSEEEIRELAALQREILVNAVRYVKPGGTLLFSTCTMTEEENLANAVRLMQEDGLKPADIREAVPEAFQEGLIEANCLQLLPSALSDGFFISVWEKNHE